MYIVDIFILFQKLFIYHYYWVPLHEFYNYFEFFSNLPIRSTCESEN